MSKKETITDKINFWKAKLTNEEDELLLLKTQIEVCGAKISLFKDFIFELKNLESETCQNDK